MEIRKKHRDLARYLEIAVVFCVTAAIIAITALSYSTNQKKVHDVRRKSDLRVIGQALKQYFETCGYSYPSEVIMGETITCPPPSVRTYLTNVPGDPKTGMSYTYSRGKNNDTFSLCTNDLEAEYVTKFCIVNH